jgi:hypothetical protein
MRKGFLLPCLLATLAAFAGCSSGDGDSSTSAEDEATLEKLRDAYAALEAAAGDVPGARLPPHRSGRETVVLENPEDWEENALVRPGDLRLLKYFAERGITFGLALIKDEGERSLALSGIEVIDAPGAITLIIPREQRTGSPPELLEASAAFAAMAPSGAIYCIDDAESGVERCTPADIP